jgi:ribonuclease HII
MSTAQSNHRLIICGIDEAGRGPLAGPVTAAAVILDPDRPVAGLRDSKLISHKRRLILADMIRRDALAWAVASASVEEIDSLNIRNATLLAMKRAHEALAVTPQLTLTDGVDTPAISGEARSVIGGDRTVAEISAASILAKTQRDDAMEKLDALWPQYGFARHKGYGTAEHLAALRAHGPCPAHRVTFSPVRAAIRDAVTK